MISESTMNQETRDFIKKYQNEDVRQLALQTARYPEVDMPFALNQIRGRKVAQTKLPSWAGVEDLIYPPHLSMEQCSSEATARYKASLLSSGETFVDLTGGFGVDFSFLARSFRNAVYVERQEHLCETARHNFPLLGLSAEVVYSDGVEYLHSMNHVSVIFLDPARRNEHGGKTVFLQDCTPDVTALRDELLEKADTVMVKLSPMLDWHEAVKTLACVSEVHIVSVENECKELLLVMKRETVEYPTVVCVNLKGDDTEIFKFAEPVVDMSVVKKLPNLKDFNGFFYEPNASVMKAGCFDEIACFFKITPVGKNSHLFVSDHLIEDFPGRKFQIIAVSSMNKKELKDTMGNLNRANIAVRNFPMSAVELRKRLKLKDGGDVYLFGTTTDEGKHLLMVGKRMAC